MKVVQNSKNSLQSVIGRIMLIIVLSGLSYSLYAQKDTKDCVELFKNQEWSEAARCYTIQIETNSKDVFSYWLRSYCYWYLDLNKRALSDISDAIKYHDKKKHKDIPKDELYLFRARIYTVMEAYDEALKDFASAQKVNPKNTDVYFERANLYYVLGKYDSSDNDWQQVLNIDKSNHAASVGLARNMLARKEVDKVISILDRLEREDNAYALIYKYRSQAFAEKEDYRKAIDDAVSYIYYDDWEDDYSAYHLYEYAKKNYTYATVKVSARVLRATDDKIQWLALRADLYEKQELYRDALNDYNSILELLREPSPHLFRDRGYVYTELGEYDKAIADFDEGLKLKETAVLYRARAYAKSSKKDFDAAIIDYSKAIEMQPMSYSLYEERGWAKERNKDFQGALKDYTTSVEIEPEYSYGFYMRGRLHKLSLNNPELAKQDFETVLTITDTLNIEMCNEKIFALALLGREKEAIAWQDSLTQRNTTSMSYYNAVCTYSLMNKPKEAIANMQTAFEKGYRNFSYLETDTDLDNIRNNPNFIKLVNEWKNKAQENSVISTDNEEKTETQKYIVKSKELRSGVYEIQSSVNDLPLKFIFDTGASSISISSLDAAFMLKNGHLSEYDFRDRQHFRTASGDLAEGTKVILRKVNIGGLELTNIEASVSHSQNAPLLFGQSALGKFAKITIDNKNNEIIFEK